MMSSPSEKKTSPSPSSSSSSCGLKFRPGSSFYSIDMLLGVKRGNHDKEDDQEEENSAKKVAEANEVASKFLANIPKGKVPLL